MGSSHRQVHGPTTGISMDERGCQGANIYRRAAALRLPQRSSAAAQGAPPWRAPSSPVPLAKRRRTCWLAPARRGSSGSPARARTCRLGSRSRRARHPRARSGRQRRDRSCRSGDQSTRPARQDLGRSPLSLLRERADRARTPRYPTHTRSGARVGPGAHAYCNGVPSGKGRSRTSVPRKNCESCSGPPSSPPLAPPPRCTQ